MKNKIICVQVEVISIDRVKRMIGKTVELKEGQSFDKIASLSPIIYQNTETPATAGTLSEETVTFTHEDERDDIFTPNTRNFILRLTTDSSNFIVGSLQYPAIIQKNSDKRTTTATFKAVHPV